MDNKNKPLLLGLVISASLTAAVFGFLVYVTTFSQDAIDRKNNVPETGWEGFIAMLLLGPIFLGLFLLTLFLYVVYRRRRKREVIQPQVDLQKGSSENNPNTKTD